MIRRYASEAELVAEHRAKNPKSRAQSVFVFHDNTGSRKSKRCILCGEVGPTWAAEWRKTERAKLWEAEHLVKHLEEGAAA